MTWDYRSLCPEIDFAAEGQGNEGGTNVYDNCVPSAALLCAYMLTGHDLAEPQDITDKKYGSTYHGVEDMAHSLAYLAMIGFDGNDRAVSLTDYAAYIEQCGALHYPMVLYVHCDSQAHIVPYYTGFAHACCPIAGDGSYITLWANGFYGGVVTMSHALVNQCVAGGMTVFYERIPDPVSPVVEDIMKAAISERPDGAQDFYCLGQAPDQNHIYHCVYGPDGSQGNFELLTDQNGDPHGFKNILGATSKPMPRVWGEGMSNGEIYTFTYVRPGVWNLRKESGAVEH